jgi:capsular exopolysaccharide synthesis family protein
MKQQFGLIDLYQMFLRRRWILLYAVLGCLLISALHLAFKSPVYISGSTFSLEPIRNNSMGFNPGNYYYYQDQTRPLEYYQAIISSRQFMGSLLEAVSKQDTLLSRIHISQKVLESTVGSSLSLSSSKFTNFIRLTAKANDPTLAYLIAQEVTDLFKIRCQEVDKEEQQNAVNYIEEQKRIASEKLDEAERALNQFKEQANLGVSTLEDGGITKELARMENQLTAIQTDKQLAEANLAAYVRKLSQIQGLEDTPAVDTRSPQLDAFREELSNLEAQRGRLAQTADPSGAQVAALDRQIEDKKRAMINFFLKSANRTSDAAADGSITLWKSLQERKITEELNVFVLANREQYYKNLIAGFKKRNPNLMKSTTELMRLSRAKSVSENLYNFLLQRGEETKIQAATGTGGISIIDRPSFPRNPISKNTTMRLLMAMILGLSLGVGIILVLEYTNNTIRSQDDISDYLKIPMMGVVPDFKIIGKESKPAQFAWLQTKKKKKTLQKPDPGRTDVVHPEKFLILNLKSKDPVVEAYRNIRSNFQFAGVDKKRRSVLVSSPDPGDGKTVTTANLGIIFAMLGFKVVIVDADLRKPKQHSMCGLKQEPGLTEALIDGLALKDISKPSGIENLNIISSGKRPPNPAEMLASRKMAEFIESLEKTADLVIYDSPPLSVVTDPMILVSKMDGVLMVLRHQGTNRFQALDVVERVHKAGGDVLGAVLNRTNVSAGYGYYYRYYYNKYYHKD